MSEPKNPYDPFVMIELYDNNCMNKIIRNDMELIFYYSLKSMMVVKD